MKRAAIIALSLGLVITPCALALDESLNISQYAHRSWTIRDGAFKGIISSIAQTPDGYLLLGTEFGIYRFDGLHAAPWTPPDNERLPSGLILVLFIARDGGVWIGYNGGLARWSAGKVTDYPEFSGSGVRSILEDREGTIWVGAYSLPDGKLCAIRSGSIRCFGQDGRFGREVISLFMGVGYLWAATDTELWQWRLGSPQKHSGFRFGMPQVLNRTDDGRVVFLSDGTIQEIVNGDVRAYPIQAVDRLFRPYNLFRDRDGGFWLGSLDRGLAVMHGPKITHFARSDGLSGNKIHYFFEDREANVWVSTDGGLDRFSAPPVSAISVAEGLSSEAAQSVLAAADGTVWTATPNGLNRWNRGHITIFRKANGLQDDDPGALFEDNGGRIWTASSHGLAWLKNGRFVSIKDSPGGKVHAIASDSDGDLWLSEERNLLHLRSGRLVEAFPWSHLRPNKQFALALLSDPKLGGLWMGWIVGGGLDYFQNGGIRRSYTTADGLGRGVVAGIQLDADGTVWASTEGGLSRIRNGHIATLTMRNGLPCDTVRWSIRDNERSMWLYTSCGLVRIARTEIDAWADNPTRRIQGTLFDATDGVRLSSNYVRGASPHVAKSADGRIWFVTTDGVQVIDPRHLPFNKTPPPVHIESVKADGRAWDVKSGLRLPARTRDVWFTYTALSLSAPEKVRFRYKLEGQEPDWKEFLNEREARYSNLPPRKYRFRVTAANSSGVWNEAGDTLEFSIAPAFYQTYWFLGACLGIGLAVTWGLYRFRVHQISREFNAHLEGRVDERIRVARELHDTLLQSCQASLIQMQAARDLFSRRPAQAAQNLDDAITMASGAIAEGRIAIQELRSQSAVQDDLAKVLTLTGQDLTRSQELKACPVIFRVEIEGERQPLKPLLQDEVHRIARELLRNAFCHAQASHIEAEIRYEPHLLHVHVRDDGKGIDPEVLKAGGRDGHWGLAGVRERAKHIGARLDFWSEARSGTEVRLTIPASIAYETDHKETRPWIFRRRRAGS